MAEVTKRKIASIYSLIAGFFLSLFSGHAHAGQFFKPTPSKSNTTTTTQTAQRQIITADQVKSSPPATVQSGGQTGFYLAPAPVQSGGEAGFYLSPAPAQAVGTTTTGFSSAYELTNTDEQAFVIHQAEARGLKATQLGKEELTGLRIEYLQNKLNELETTLHQLQEGQGN